jgi:hypothetical protein
VVFLDELAKFDASIAPEILETLSQVNRAADGGFEYSTDDYKKL